MYVIFFLKITQDYFFTYFFLRALDITNSGVCFFFYVSSNEKDVEC
jgi:hypothetical protein